MVAYVMPTTSFGFTRTRTTLAAATASTTASTTAAAAAAATVATGRRVSAGLLFDLVRLIFRI